MRVSLGGAKEDLILSKLDWAREPLSERQLADVANLMATCRVLSQSRSRSPSLASESQTHRASGGDGMGKDAHMNAFISASAPTGGVIPASQMLV